MYRYYRREAPLATPASAAPANNAGAATTGPGFITSGRLDPTFTPTRSPDPTQAPVFSSSSSPSSISSSSDPSQQTGTTTTSSSSIPLGTLVGAIVGSVIFLFLVICLVLWQSKKQKADRMKRSVSTRRNYERRKSGREMAWKELGEGGGSVEGGSEENKTMGLQAYPPHNNHQQLLSPSSIPQIPKLSPIFDPKEFKSVLGGGRTPSPSSPPDQPLPSTFQQQQQQQPMMHLYSNVNNARPSPSATPTTATTTKQDGQEAQYPAFSHPYAKVPGIQPSSPSEGSFYTASSPGMNSTFSQQQQQQQPPSSPSIIPIRTGDRSHNHNPFFTAHPSAEEYNKSGREKWGSIGKERVVSMSMSDDNNTSVVLPTSTAASSTRAGGPEERAPSRLESLIAALDFGSGGGTAELETPPNKSRLASIYSTASSGMGVNGDTDFEQAYGDAIGTNLTTRSSHLHYSNPFEFDQVYGIRHEQEEEVVRDSFRSSGVGGLMSGIVPPGTGTTAEFSERSMVLSPSEFPMPPPR